jgi:thiol:disulfide interchange protein DsbD
LDQYKFVLTEPSHFYLSEFQVRPTVKFTDPLTKKTKVGTEGYAEMVSLLEIPTNINGGVHELKFALTYQACGKDFCLFPKTISFSHKIEIAGVAQDRLRTALEKGWVYALFIVFIAGILTSLTPCIFPMIPITLAVLGTKDHGQSRSKGFILSSIYVLGIALTYALLGVVAAKTGALFGSLLGHPLVVGTIALLFVLMGLSMFGLFEIQVPQALTQKLSSQQSRKGYIGAFLSGLVAGVVASPCVGPVLISILAYVAQTQNVVTGFILLFVYALGLGQLFLLIGTFHTLWQRLPRSGVWMERVKFVFGSIMIGMAFYFIYPVTHSALFDGLLATAFLGLAFLTGFYKRHPGPLGTFEKFRRAGGYLLVGLGVLFAMKSLIPAHMKEKLFP